jgi:hypothetical protein
MKWLQNGRWSSEAVSELGKNQGGGGASNMHGEGVANRPCVSCGWTCAGIFVSQAVCCVGASAVCFRRIHT